MCYLLEIEDAKPPSSVRSHELLFSNTCPYLKAIPAFTNPALVGGKGSKVNPRAESMCKDDMRQTLRSLKTRYDTEAPAAPPVWYICLMGEQKVRR